jgi:hypothetical protein
MKTYELIPACTVRNLDSKYLLTVYPEDAVPFALDVNASFAYLVKKAQEMGSFTAEDLARALTNEYGLSPDTAAHEAHATLSLWQEHGLLQ